MLDSQIISHNSTQPLVTFIITTYNLNAELLKECVESITKLSTSIDEREIIVIDDGSDLPALNSLTSVCKNIVYLWQPNNGASAARNIGLDIAHGKYIQFVDGDDYLISATYEHCLDIARYHNPDMVMFEHTSKNDSVVTEMYDGPFSGAEFMHNNNIKGMAWGYIFKKDILMSLRFNRNIKFGEDEEFTAQLIIRAERLFTIPSKAYFYRQRSNSVVHEINKRTKVQRLEENESIIFHLHDMLDKLPKAERAAMERRIAQLSMDYLYNTARLTHSYSHLNDACERLRRRGLFPLPDKKYTRKYSLFRKMSKNAIGRRLIIATAI
ncbi:glycosyltransferase family 2 protein [Prevotella sp.]|uniref:glycosyltransferase family 2 protein n=1 Tax=Prevotella sp. TaxID=59823 RepID=UPI003DA53268